MAVIESVETSLTFQFFCRFFVRRHAPIYAVIGNISILL